MVFSFFNIIYNHDKTNTECRKEVNVKSGRRVIVPLQQQKETSNSQHFHRKVDKRRTRGKELHKKKETHIASKHLHVYQSCSKIIHEKNIRYNHVLSQQEIKVVDVIHAYRKKEPAPYICSAYSKTKS